MEPTGRVNDFSHRPDFLVDLTSIKILTESRIPFVSWPWLGHGNFNYVFFDMVK